MKFIEEKSFWSILELTCILFVTSACQSAPVPTLAATPNLVPTPSPEAEVDCSEVKRLPNDSVEAQQILDEFVLNFKEHQPTEYMGMAVLGRVDRLGEWAVVQGSVSGDDKNILVVHRTSEGYQLVEEYLVVPSLAEDEGSDQRITQYFLERLPDAPPALFTCLEQTWFPERMPETPTEPLPVHELIYITTDDYTTAGVTEIHSILSDGSNPTLLLSAAMMIMDLTLSSDGEQFLFWGCPGSIAFDCIPAEEDLDIWAMNWDGSDLKNLTEGFTANDAHPDWSPGGKQIVFDSNRSGSDQLYIMDADGSRPKALTNDSLRNTEPKWSPDGKWIAYHCRQGFHTSICVISPKGQPAGGPIVGVEPVWSPVTAEGNVRLAYLCSHETPNDICIAGPDGLDIVNLTNASSNEHSPAWSPDGKWLTFVSNRHDDIDIYKVCVTCPGEPAWVRLTDEPSAAGWPAWSPDGSRVAYVSAESLMLVRADRTRLNFLEWSVFNPPIWRPQVKS